MPTTLLLQKFLHRVEKECIIRAHPLQKVPRTLGGVSRYHPHALYFPPFFSAFCCYAIPKFHCILNVFSLVYVTLMKFAIYHRAAKCLFSQASSVDECIMGWSITDPGICSNTGSMTELALDLPVLSPFTLTVFLIQRSYISLLSALCLSVKMKKMA